MSYFNKMTTALNVIKERGLVETCKFSYDLIAKKLFSTNRIEFIWLDPTNASAPEVKGTYEFRFLTPEDLHKFLPDHIYELNTTVIERLSSGKHFCYAALDGDKLAAYSWYALGDVLPEDCFGFALILPPEIAYMYKGFTHPDYRGKRLHGYLMVHGLLHLQPQGVKYLVSSIDWLNTASIKSSERIGYKKLGQGTSWKFLGKLKQDYPAELLAKGIKH